MTRGHKEALTVLRDRGVWRLLFRGLRSRDGGIRSSRRVRIHGRGRRVIHPCAGEGVPTRAGRGSSGKGGRRVSAGDHRHQPMRQGVKEGKTERSRGPERGGRSSSGGGRRWRRG